VGFTEEEEELMKGMTVMQRYHYKRKINMQRMEQEVRVRGHAVPRRLGLQQQGHLIVPTHPGAHACGGW
jgi:predicted transcriptional regulator